MSADDIEILRQGHALFNGGDFDAAVAMMDPEVEWVDPAELPGATTHHTRDGVRKWFDAFTESWGEWKMEPQEFIDAGDGVYVVPTFFTATGKGSGVPTEIRLGSVWRLRDGLAYRVEYYLDPEAAQRAAGLEPGLGD